MGGWGFSKWGFGPKSWHKSFDKFAFGEEGKIHQVSNLRPDQEPLSEQLVQAGLKPGAGGAFGTAADYYRNNLSDNPADLAAFSAPALRQYNEEIVPNISEQFAGMGSGGLSSSGFRNAQVQGGVDLAERIGALRAGLRHSSAQGLTNIGQLGLQSFQTNHETPGTPGLFETVAPAAASAAVTAFAGPAAGAATYGVMNGVSNTKGNWFNGKGNMVGSNSSPYGNATASPKASPGGGR